MNQRRNERRIENIKQKNIFFVSFCFRMQSIKGYLVEQKNKKKTGTQKSSNAYRHIASIFVSDRNVMNLKLVSGTTVLRLYEWQ